MDALNGSPPTPASTDAYDILLEGLSAGLEPQDMHLVEGLRRTLSRGPVAVGGDAFEKAAA